jgi:hypothetical protein
MPSRRASQKLCERADETLRPTSNTDRRAQVHQGLVEEPGLPWGQELPRKLFELSVSLCLTNSEESRQDAPHVGVHDRLILAERDAHYGPGGVAPDARQLQKLFSALRDFPAVVAQHDLGGSVEMARAGVVPQPFPRFEHFIERGAREALQRRKSFKKSSVILAHALHLGLLEHNLGDQDMIRVVGRAPRQIALMAAVPREKRFSDRLFKLWGH